MSRERNKPQGTWIERCVNEFEHEEELLIKRSFELGKIRGRKETVEKVCEWLENNYFNYNFEDGFDKSIIDDLKKSMEV